MEGAQVAPSDAGISQNRRSRLYAGGFREADFVAEATRRFAADRAVAGRFNAASTPAMMDVLGRIGRDPRIVDVRWMAYMLATVMWETNHLVTVPAVPPARRAHRAPRWGTPVEESGRGRINVHDVKAYYLPAKVQRSPTGGATVTEQDGDVFQVGENGRILHQSSDARVGASAAGGAAPDQAYVRAAGAEKAYYGRGYCQLTWWNNYASTGAEIGLGLTLLLDPERALEPAIAYEVMAHGMVHGTGFANGKRFQMYFLGSHTDYVGARAMVNGTDHAAEIAHIARIFEDCLMRTKA